MLLILALLGSVCTSCALTMGAASRHAVRVHSATMQFSTGFTFDDGASGERLASVQKPLGLVLVPLDDDDDAGVIVKDVAPGGNAERAGVLVGDIVLAVNNLDMRDASLASVLAAVEGVPGRVVNLRTRPVSSGGFSSW